MNHRIAVVTGAGRGIGKAIAEGLADKGVIPVVVDIDKTNADGVADEIRKKNRVAESLRIDLSDIDQIKRMVAEVVEKYGTIHILVNNAGILFPTDYDRITVEEWDTLMAVNLRAPFFATQQVLPYMVKQKWGRVVNISSLAGRNGGYGAGAHYAASKFGIVGLTMNLAKKVAMHGVTINAVAPGVTATEMIMKLSQERRSELLAMIPAARFARTKNIADAVVFLASDEAEYMTGVVLDVNGGIFMG